MVEGGPLPELYGKSEIIRMYVNGMAVSDRTVLNTVDGNNTFK